MHTLQRSTRMAISRKWIRTAISYADTRWRENVWARPGFGPWISAEINAPFITPPRENAYFVTTFAKRKLCPTSIRRCLEVRPADYVSLVMVRFWLLIVSPFTD